MICKTVCSLCDKLIISQAVTFANNELVINLPARAYNNGCKYCIVIAQTIPDTATINAPVVITIGSETTAYPLTKCDCSSVTACGIRTRTRYSTKVITNATGGTFRLMGKTCCAPNNDLESIGGAISTTPTE